jgi:hypothetical protein
MVKSKVENDRLISIGYHYLLVEAQDNLHPLPGYIKEKIKNSAPVKVIDHPAGASMLFALEHGKNPLEWKKQPYVDKIRIYRIAD